MGSSHGDAHPFTRKLLQNIPNIYNARASHHFFLRFARTHDSDILVSLSSGIWNGEHWYFRGRKAVPDAAKSSANGVCALFLVTTLVCFVESTTLSNTVA
jgi:hypothetical protein